MDNATRRQLLQKHKMSGFPGSIMDVFQAHEQGVDLIDQFQQQQMQVAKTPQERQQGLRPAHQSGNTNASMAFPDTPPNASFNTMGMKSPIDVKQFDDTGNLVKSYDAVPPGVTDLKMSSKGGTVIETPSQMQSGGLYNYDRAMELGYEPDEFGHLPSVDDQNGMWLKSAKHPTAVKELLHGYLGADHYKTHKLTANPEGYFGEDQLQYIPRKMQEGGEYRDPDVPQVGIPTFAAFPVNASNSNRLDYRVAEEIAKRKGGTAEMYLAAADTIGYHESGHHQRMAVNAWQNQSETSPGKGTFQNEGKQYKGSNTLETTQNHLDRTMGYWGESIPPRIANATDASTLSYEDQRALALAHLLQGRVPMADYASGDISLADVWAKGWKKSDANKASFEASRLHAKTQGIPQTNYIERRYGGIKRIRKAQDGGAVPTLYVDDPNHPRIQQYADSLQAYNFGVQGKAMSESSVQKALDEYNSRNNFTKTNNAFPQTSSINTNTSKTILGLQPSSSYKTTFMAPAPHDPNINMPVQLPIPGGQNKLLSSSEYSLWDKPKQPVVYRAPFQKMNPLPPANIQSPREKAALQPVMGNTQMRRKPTPIYQQDQGVSTGQYQIGENLWDPNKRQWRRDVWDKETQQEFRNQAVPRGQYLKASFKKGGIRK